MERCHGGDWAGYLQEYGEMPLDFSASISPLGLPEGVRRAVTEALPHADRYPDPLCRELRRRLGETLHVPPEWLRCGSGAADLLYRLTFAERPKRALIPAPGFLEYEAALNAAGCQAEPYVLREEDNFSLTEAVLPLLTPEIDLLFLCEPGNPSGVTTPRRLLLQILERCRGTGIRPVADECFLDFLAREDCSLLPELREFPDLVILRAFTKQYAMAGIRLGYCVTADAEFLNRMDACGQPWPVSSLAQAAGIAALEETDYLKRLRELVARERTGMREKLTALGLRVIPGEANFLLFFCSDFLLAEKLRARGILIRDCANYRGLSRGWYRTAVRTEAENEILLHAIREVLGWQKD